MLKGYDRFSQILQNGGPLDGDFVAPTEEHAVARGNGILFGQRDVVHVGVELEGFGHAHQGQVVGFARFAGIGGMDDYVLNVADLQHVGGLLAEVVGARVHHVLAVTPGDAIAGR
jgi:hypothetical protein